MVVRYATREDIKSALDTRSTARTDAQIDRALASASRSVESLCAGRRFYPTIGTRYLNWPDENEPYAPSWRIWLHQDELISVTALDAGGVALTENTDYFLEPINDGPPYRRLEINRGGGAVFSYATTPQRAIAVTGVFGGFEGYEHVADVSATVTTAHRTLTFTPEQVGVGDTVRIDDEFIHLTDIGYGDTGVDLAAPLASSTGDNAVQVADGSQFVRDEVIRVGTEAMLIIAVTGNTLSVRRAHDGSVLAAHDTGDDIWAERAFAVERGALGSTIAEHTNGAAVRRLTYPPLVVDLTIAEALVRLQDEQSGYARPISNFHKSPIGEVDGLIRLREDVQLEHGPQMRTRAI